MKYYHILLSMVLMLILISCKSENIKMNHKSLIPSVTCDQFFKESSGCWNWSQPILEPNNNLRNLINECKFDYKKEHPSDVLTLQSIYKSKDGKFLFFVFDVKYSDDCVIAYAYDIKAKKLSAKFYISMA